MPNPRDSLGRFHDDTDRSRIELPTGVKWFSPSSRSFFRKLGYCRIATVGTQDRKKRARRSFPAQSPARHDLMDPCKKE